MASPLTIEDLKNVQPSELKKRFPKLNSLNTVSNSSVSAPISSPPDSGLEPYTGVWTQREAKHLLSRAMFGPNLDRINQAISLGLESSVETLLADFTMPTPPVNTTSDTDVPIGETWVDTIYTDTEQQTTRSFSLVSWNYGLLLNEDFSAREQMTLFWHNHFSVSGSIVEDPRVIYSYITLIRENAFGNFKELCKAMTIENAMLQFLNGSQNFAEAPNENFARELFELFTIGKGPLAGPGDYTNYTEDDIAAAAKVLTGWTDLGTFAFVEGTQEISGAFVPVNHDSQDKQFSERFNDTVIGDLGDQEYSALIDMIFEQDECAKFLCRKLYRWFCHYIIDESVETNMIEPMAQILIDNDYDIKPVLEALFKSAHFYDSDLVGCMIHNPINYVIGMLNRFNVPIDDSEVVSLYNTWIGLAFAIPLLQQDYFNPPSVAGWQAYYQEPLFYRKWINSVTLPIRMIIPPALLFNGLQIEDGQLLKIDSLEFINSMAEPSDVNLLIEEVTNFLYGRPITQAQTIYLKQYLIPGLPDFEWNIEYTDYLDDPDNPDLQNSIRNKTNLFLYGCLTLPEALLT